MSICNNLIILDYKCSAYTIISRFTRTNYTIYTRKKTLIFFPFYIFPYFFNFLGGFT